jgi:predicted DsbA family dithiol-disulfide isomerase
VPASDSPPSHLELWVDPSCPWAWQTATWFRALRDRGLLDIEWNLFSLELNASEPGLPFPEAAARYGRALVALALARRDDGAPAFEALYVAVGRRLHQEREEMSEALLIEATEEAGLSGLLDRADDGSHIVDEVVAEHLAARDRSVFGVPTFTIDGSKPAYGPILSLAPTGEEALSWWGHIRWLAERPEFFEMKRWPRDLRPGHGPTPA